MRYSIFVLFLALVGCDDLTLWRASELKFKAGDIVHPTEADNAFYRECVGVIKSYASSLYVRESQVATTKPRYTVSLSCPGWKDPVDYYFSEPDLELVK